MSTQIDQRVVQMKFDNASFEKNAAVTLSTLDKFKNALNFKGAEKGLQELQTAANHIDMSGLEKSANKIGVSFDTMSMIAISAINRIVNSAMSAGERILKSLTIEPPTVGFSKYEEKTKAVVTIMNATGKSIDEVNEQLERLNLFTDETSYNFTDMVSNIGKFTSNNVPLEQAVNAMQGIANLAAISGQGINEASRAMYNFSQAVSVGSVKLMDWRSIQNANMATSEFKETIIDTALKMGTLRKSADGMTKTLKGTTVSATDFESALSEGWFTSDVLLKSLDRYGSYATEVLNLMSEEGITCSEAMEKLGGDMNSLGARAFRAAQEAKTFTDAIEATKDAVSTGWSKTFEIIFGDYEEAKEMWTALTNELWELFASSAEGRNEILQEWKDLGGRTNLLEGISKAWERLKDIMTVVKTATNEMFPPLTGERLKYFTDKLKELADNMKLSEEGAYTLKVAVKALLLPLKVLLQVLGAVGSIGFAITKTLFKMGDAFLSLFAKADPLKDTFTKLFGDERYQRLAAAWDSIITRVSGAFGRLKNRIEQFTQSLKEGEKTFSLFDTLWNFISPLANLSLNGFIWALESIAAIDFTDVNTFAGKTLAYLKTGFEAVKDVISPITNGIRDFINSLAEADPSQWFDILTDSVTRFKNKCVEFLEKFNLSKGWDKFEEKFPALAAGLEKLGDAMVKFVKKLDPAKILVYSFGVALVGLIFSIMNVMDATKKAVGGLSALFGNINSILKGFAKQYPVITQITKAIIVLTAALVILSNIDRDKLVQAVAALSVVIGLFGIIAGATAAIDKFVISDGKKLWKFAVSLTAIAGSITLLAGALKLLSTIRLDSTIWKSLGMLTVIIGELLAVSFVLGKGKVEFARNVLFFLSFASSINLLISALKKINDVNMTNIPGTVAALGMVIFSMASLAKAMQSIDLQKSVGATVAVFNLLILVAALKKLAKVDPAELYPAVKAFIPLLGAIALLNVASIFAGEHAHKAGAYILAIALAMLMLQSLIKNLSEINGKDLVKATASVAAILAMFALITGISHFAGSTKGLGRTILAMSAAMMLLGTAVSYFGNLDPKVAARGVALVGGFMGIFAIIMKVGDASKKATGAIVAMTVAIGLVTTSLMLLTLIDWKELVPAAASFGIALASLGAAMYGISKVMAVTGGGSMKGLLKSVMTLIAIIGPIAGLLYLLNGIDGRNALKNALAMSTVLIAIAGVSKRIMGIEASKDDAKKLAILGLVLLEAAGALAMLDVLSDDGVGLVAKAVALGIVLRELSKSVTIITNMKLKTNLFKVFGILGLVLFEASFALAMLDTLTGDPVKTIGNAVALGMVLLALSVTVRIMNGFEVPASMATTMVLLGVILAEAVAALAALDHFTNGDGLVQKVLALAAVLGVMTLLTGAMGILGFIPGLIPAVASGAAALILACGLIGGALGIVGSLVDESEGMVEKLQNGAVVFGIIGEAVGNLIGGFVKGIASKSAEALPSIGKSLGDFMENSQPFFTGVSQMTVEKVQSVTNLAEAIKTMSKIKVDNLSDNLTEIGNQLVAFAPSMREFGTIMTGIDPQTLLASAQAATYFADFCKALPQRDGKLDTWFGKKDMAEFGQDLADFGLYLWQYSKYTDGIDWEMVDASTASAMALAKLNDVLPQREGGLDFFIGRKDMAEFGSDLERFGAHMAVYAHNIKDVDFDLVNKSSSIAMTLVKLNDALPQRGGALDAWIGAKDLVNFGSDLDRFGAHMAVYAYNIKDLPSDLVTKTQMIADAVTILVGVIPEQGGLFAKLFGGDQDFSSFANGLSAVSEAIDTLANSIEVSQFHDLGKEIIFQLAAGMTDYMHLATGAIDEVAKEVIAMAKDRFEIESPSKAFQKIGYYVVKGLANGIDENESIASKAMTYLSSKLLRAIKSFFGIHSPSVVMKEEVGVYLVKGIADGITSEMSAEEAASKKAQNIIDAFKSTLDKFSLDMSTADLEYGLWEKTEGLKASDAVKTQKQQEMLTKKLEAQGKRVVAANAQYQATLEALGEGAYQTQQAYNTWLQEQSNLADLAQQMTETVGAVNEASEDLFVSYAKLLGENRADLQKMGFTDEEIESWASEKLGGYVPGMVKDTTEKMTDEFNKADVNSIISHFTSNIGVELDYTLTEAIKSSGATGRAAANVAGQDIMSGMEEGVKEGGGGVIEQAKKVADELFPNLADAISGDGIAGKFVGSAANVVEGWISGWGGSVGSAIETVKNSGLQIIDTINEALGVKSPSWKTKESAEYVLEGFKNGLESDPNPAVDAATALGNKVIQAFNSAMTTSNENGENLKTSESLSPAAEAGAKIVTEFAKGIESQHDIFLESIQLMIAEIIQTVEVSGPDFQASGTAIATIFMDAMLAGVQSKEQMILDEVRRIAEEAKKAAEDILGDLIGGGGTTPTQSSSSGGGGGKGKAGSYFTKNQKERYMVPGETIESLQELKNAAKSNANSKVLDLSKSIGSASLLSSAIGVSTPTIVKQNVTNVSNATYNQTINSPKAPNRTTLYRDSKSLFAQSLKNTAKGGVKTK